VRRARDFESTIVEPLEWVREQGVVLQWPALVRVADRFPGERLAAIDEEHTASGAHRTTEIPFPEWVPVDDMTAAGLLTVDDALAQLPACLR
jgi:hypothetical protein